MSVQSNRLYRSRRDKMICGVCAGLGEYFDIDPTIVRLLFVVGTILSGGVGLVVYIAMWLIVPQEGEERATFSNLTHPPGAPAAEGTETLEGQPPLPGEPSEPREHRRGWGGIILISVGLLLLAHNLEWTWWINWRLFWPALLVAVGLWLLARRVQH